MNLQESGRLCIVDATDIRMVKHHIYRASNSLYGSVCILYTGRCCKIIKLIYLWPHLLAVLHYIVLYERIPVASGGGA